MEELARFIVKMSLCDLHDEFVIWSLKSGKLVDLIHDVVNAVSTKMVVLFSNFACHLCAWVVTAASPVWCSSCLNLKAAALCRDLQFGTIASIFFNWGWFSQTLRLMWRGCTFVLSLARAEDVFRLLMAGRSAFFWKRAYHGRCIAGSWTPPKHLENSGCEAEKRILAKRRCLFAAGFRPAPCCQLLRHNLTAPSTAQKRQETHGDTCCCDGLVRCQLVDIRSSPSWWPTMSF